MLIGSSPLVPVQPTPQDGQAPKVPVSPLPVNEVPAISPLASSSEANADAPSNRGANSDSQTRQKELEQKEAQRKKEAAEANDRKLADRDREVRAHELAHLAAGGPYVSPMDFTYERGSNGVMYAVGGEVGIDTSPVPGDPQATLEKAETVRRAALAPAQPSAQDMRVAAEAATMALEARAELTRELGESRNPAAGYAGAQENPDDRALGDSVDLYA